MMTIDIKNKLLLMVIVSICLTICSCSDDENDSQEIVPPTSTGEFVDSRDGEVYHWVEYDGLQWMTENFRYDILSYANCRNYIDEQDWVDYAPEQHATRNRAKYGMY